MCGGKRRLCILNRSEHDYKMNNNYKMTHMKIIWLLLVGLVFTSVCHARVTLTTTVDATFISRIDAPNIEKLYKSLDLDYFNFKEIKIYEENHCSRDSILNSIGKLLDKVFLGSYNMLFLKKLKENGILLVYPKKRFIQEDASHKFLLSSFYSFKDDIKEKKPLIIYNWDKAIEDEEFNYVMNELSPDVALLTSSYKTASEQFLKAFICSLDAHESGTLGDAYLSARNRYRLLNEEKESKIKLLSYVYFGLPYAKFSLPNPKPSREEVLLPCEDFDEYIKLLPLFKSSLPAAPGQQKDELNVTNNGDIPIDLDIWEYHAKQIKTFCDQHSHKFQLKWYDGFVLAYPLSRLIYSSIYPYEEYSHPYYKPIHKVIYLAAEYCKGYFQLEKYPEKTYMGEY
ncbi:hypothetical protein DRJ17_04975 [Candidatus Woesearchaeota archaeon]|nr:MAG: hypothetical protein DRJ17_04975 [Candidatus Woesearchaeota archaeon]